MLLMDSLGGASKALMIACVSPSDVYADETLSTLNYATRTMNIKNKPVIKMDAKEQIKYNLKREIQLLQMQNNFLRQEYMKVTGESFVDIPEQAELEQLVGGVSGGPGLFPSISGKGQNMSQLSHSFDDGVGGGMGSGKGGKGSKNSAYGLMQKDQRLALQNGDQLSMMEHQLNTLRQENAQMRYQKELINREFEGMMYENINLSSKLANLEKVFIGESSAGLDQDQDDPSNKKYSHGLLVTENNELRARIEQAELEKIELKGIMIQLEADHSPSTGMTRDDSRDMSPTSVRKIMNINQANKYKDEPPLYYNGKQSVNNDYDDDYQKPSSSQSKKSTNSSYMRFKQSMNNHK
jgi:kinesin family protein 12